MSGEAVKEVPVTARIPVADVKQLEALAKAGDRSRAAEFRRAVRAYLETREKESA